MKTPNFSADFFAGRRQFLKQVARWSASSMLAIPVFSIPSRLLAASGFPSEIFESTGTDYEKLIVGLVDGMGGMERFVKKGSKVVVKPNIGWDRNPDQAANTHPLVVKILVKLALDAGAGSVKVFDRTCNEERRCYHNSGIKPTLDDIKDKRLSCNYIDDRKFVPVNIKHGKALKKWDFYKDALEADCYINVPVAKHHGSARLSLGLKNVMGVIGGRRGRIHFNMAENLVDLNLVIRPSLTVVDATRILLRNGPQGGNVADVKVLNKVMASTDPVALDAYATTLFGEKPDSIPSTVAAHARGLGEMDLKKCSIRTV